MSSATLQSSKEFVAKSISNLAVHVALLPFCAGADTLLGPEMRSTGEVMGIDTSFAKAYAKAATAAGQKLPASGNIFISMTDKFKDAIVPIAKELQVPCSICMPCTFKRAGLSCRRPCSTQRVLCLQPGWPAPCAGPKAGLYSAHGMLACSSSAGICLGLSAALEELLRHMVCSACLGRAAQLCSDCLHRFANNSPSRGAEGGPENCTHPSLLTCSACCGRT